MSADTESGGNIANICTSQSYIGYIQYIALVSVRIESELHKLAFIVDILIQTELVRMILSVVIKSEGNLSVFIVITGLVNVKIYADALDTTAYRLSVCKSLCPDLLRHAHCTQRHNI